MNKREILYVDDEIENLMVFRFGLHNDFDIYTANSADEALTILNDKDISVVVSDQRMKGKTGIEFFEELSEKNPDIIKIFRGQ